jgi:predicted lipoprotein with Yx(FWY)xxD motif
MSFLLLLAAAAAPAEVMANTKPLYTFDRDEAGKSNCVDRCATAWPPLAAPAGAKASGRWTVVTRADGSGQWALDGKPVYTFVRDTDAKATGDGMGGMWHLVPNMGK